MVSFSFFFACVALICWCTLHFHFSRHNSTTGCNHSSVTLQKVCWRSLYSIGRNQILACIPFKNSLPKEPWWVVWNLDLLRPNHSTKFHPLQACSSMTSFSLDMWHDLLHFDTEMQKIITNETTTLDICNTSQRVEKEKRKIIPNKHR